ncbi:MFS transporter [Cognatilysobacter bugurensis]|uniref:MFS transporter n=1 Tax=Cognatilysobacter bugurensis TaxID=543356 RepID=UPI001E6073F7|nr:MFS transporter [Lysobacter bugurensis]
MVGLVSVVALEAMGSAAIMPVAATALDGLFLYGFLFGGPLAISLLGMVAAGQWSDQRGPMRAVWVGTTCFVGGLLVASIAGSVWWLLLGRLATGLGSGMIGVALYATVGRVYPASLHSRVFAAFAAAWMLPALVGPAVAGLVSGLLGWRWAILVPAALALPACAALVRVPSAAVALRETGRSKPPSRRMLWALGASVGAVVLHLVGQAGLGDAAAAGVSIGLALCAAAAMGLLYVSARRLLPTGSLVAKRGLPAAIALSGLSQGAFFAAEAFLPLLLHREKAASVGVAGVLLSAGAVTWSAGAFVRARMHSKVSVPQMLRCGFALLGAGIALSSLVLIPSAPVMIAVLGWAIAGAGMGLVSPTLSVVTLALAPTGTQGHVGASLRLSAALATTSTLAFSGATFALLLHVNVAGAYATSLGLAALLALTGGVVAGRVEGAARC